MIRFKGLIIKFKGLMIRLKGLMIRFKGFMIIFKGLIDDLWFCKSVEGAISWYDH